MKPDLQKKLLQYAPTPPAGAWENIGNALDEGLNGVLANKFDGYEVTPPQGSWNKIASRLEGQTTTAPVTNWRKFNRVAAAAAVLILAISAVFFINRKESTPAISQIPAVTIPPSTAAPQTNSDLAKENTTELQDAERNTPASKQMMASSKSKATTAYSRNTGNSKESRFDGYALAGRISEIAQPGMNNIMVTHSFIPEEAATKKTATSNIPVEKYMVYSDGEGQAMKVSKKLVEFFNCVKEEWICQEQKKILQEKMASQSTNNDFTGIMSLLRNLTEPN